jgi:hypothetical protein
MSAAVKGFYVRQHNARWGRGKMERAYGERNLEFSAVRGVPHLCPHLTFNFRMVRVVANPVTYGIRD